MEIKLVHKKDYPNMGMFKGKSPWNRQGGIELCTGAVRRVTEIPRGINVVYAVFSKQDTHPDASFTITEPTKPGVFMNNKVSQVEESGAIMTWGTRKTLATAYKNGYRYVRFEYDQA